MLKQNTATNVVLKLFSSADHITPATGKTVSVTVSKAGSAFAAISGTVSEISAGWYRVSLAAADLDTLGDLVIRGTASGCDPAERLLKVVAVDTDDSTSFGLSRLDQSVGSRLAASDFEVAPAAADVASAVWVSGSRTLTDFGFSVTAATIMDKTGYSLSIAPPTCYSDPYGAGHEQHEAR